MSGMNRRLRSTSNKTSELPVFVFPEEINFTNVNLKQILTIYNPYDYSVQFKVLCSNPKGYAVTNPKGMVAPKACVDMVIRFQLHQRSISLGSEDKFRIEVYRDATLLGRKTIKSIYRDVNHSEGATPDQSMNFEEVGRRLSRPGDPQDSSFISPPQPYQASTLTCGIMVCFLLSALAVLVLALPLDKEPNSQLPSYLHASYHMKLLAAFVLGMLTMHFLKT